MTKHYLDFIPQNIDERLAYFTALRAGIATYGPGLGLTPAQITAFQAWCTSIINKILAVKATEEARAGAEQAYSEVDGNEIKLIRKEAGRFKGLATYTKAIGESLAIVGTTVEFDPETYKPDFSGKVAGNAIRLSFKKKGVDAVNVYRRRKGTTTWAFTKTLTKSPYSDPIVLEAAGTPEHYEYRAFGVVANQEIGLPSDIVEVVYGG